MPITKSVSSKANIKQATGQDLPFTPTQLVTASYGPVASTSGQTTITLSFAVPQNITQCFQLYVGGKKMALGSANDFTFSNIQPNNTSSTITLTQSLPSGLNIEAYMMGVSTPTYSIASLQAQVNALPQNNVPNALINSAFDYWQRGTTFSVSSSASTYGADRWFCANTSGNTAVYSQVTGVVPGSKFGASLAYGASASQSGLTLMQVVENLNSLPFYGQTASFGVWVKALGNTNKVTLSISYATSETKTVSATLSSLTFTINSVGFTYCQLPGVSIGTAMTTTGCVQVSIAAGTASTGNAWASGNGIVVEQAMLNVGSTLGNFIRAGRNAEDELAMCQRYYEKTFDTSVTPVQNSGITGSVIWFTAQVANQRVTVPWDYAVRKRVAATLTFYSPNAASANWFTNGVTPTAASATNTTGGAVVAATTSMNAASDYMIHATADAEI